MNLRRMKRVALHILEKLGLPETELSLLIVDDRQIAVLNQRYLGRSGPTDVLSFPMTEAGRPVQGGALLGDVVISVERARDNAARAGRRLDQEIGALLVHGILHLVGYDHLGSRREADRMAAKALVLEKEIEPLIAGLVDLPI